MVYVLMYDYTKVSSFRLSLFLASSSLYANYVEGVAKTILDLEPCDICKVIVLYKKLIYEKICIHIKYFFSFLLASRE